MARTTEHPIFFLFLGRVREFWREPGVLFWTFGFPIVLAFGLALAFREQGVEATHVAIVRGDGDARLKSALDAAGGFDAAITDEDDARARLRRGRAALVAWPTADVRTTRVLVDDSQPIGALASRALRDALEQSNPISVHVATNVEHETTRGRRYVDFLVPGLIGFTLLNGGVWGVGYSLILMRTRKLLKRLAATPMRRSHLLLGYLSWRVLISFAEAAALLVVGALVFGMRVTGSWVGFVLLVFLSALAFGGLGLLTGARSQNPQTGNGWCNLATLPMFLLSGVFFSADRFPSWMKPVIGALPLTALNDGLRAVINDGAGLGALVGGCAVLLAWGVVSFAVALKIFRWT